MDDDEVEDEIATLREDLSEWLDGEPPDVPRFYAFSGMVTALQICPEVVMPTKLFEALRGPRGRVWKDEEEARYFAGLLRCYWNYVGDLVRAARDPDAPSDAQAIDVWTDDFASADDPRSVLAATIDWATGFLRATELWPEAWGDALSRPDVAAHWEVVRWWAEILCDNNQDRIAHAAEATPPRTIAASVRELARALRPQNGEQFPPVSPFG